jgi:hypothetical protein
VEVGEYRTLLEERFVKGKEVSYFFGKEGLIGEQLVVPRPVLGSR